MNVELVRTTTADGLRLDGAWRTPPQDAAGDLPCDACLLVHGTGANFYSSSLLEYLAGELLQRGAATLLANTRGHDIVHTAATREGPRRMGAAYEIVDDCRHDLAAWAMFLKARGYQHLLLVAHSLGAIKGVYAAAHARQPDFDYLAAVSPARLSHRHFNESSRADEFQATLSEADRLVAAGRGDELMDVGFPIPYAVTAAGYVDKYGPRERYNVLEHLPNMTRPTLVTLGALEVAEHVAFAGLPEAVAQIGRANPLVRAATIAGADHVYSQAREPLLAELCGWLAACGEEPP